MPPPSKAFSITKLSAAQIGQFVAGNGAANKRAEVLFTRSAVTSRSKIAIMARLRGDESDVRNVAFISGARVRQAREPNLHSITSTRVATASRGTSAGQ